MDDLDCPFTDLNAYGSESDKKNPRTYTPGANLTYLAPPRTIFHGCHIIHLDPRNAKNFCPQR